MSKFIVTVEPRFDGGAVGRHDAAVALSSIQGPVALASTVDISYDDRTLTGRAPVALGCVPQVDNWIWPDAAPVALGSGDPRVHEIDSGARLSPEGA